MVQSESVNKTVWPWGAGWAACALEDNSDYVLVFKMYILMLTRDSVFK